MTKETTETFNPVEDEKEIRAATAKTGGKGPDVDPIPGEVKPTDEELAAIKGNTEETETKGDEKAGDEATETGDKTEEKTNGDAQEEEAKEVNGDDKPLDTEVWGTTGNKTGDYVLQMLQNNEVSTDEAKAIMFDAVQAGDITKLDDKALVEKLGEAKAHLVKAGIKSFIEERAEATAATVKVAEEVAGNKENWDKIAGWATKGGIPEAELDGYATMIDAGGPQARFAMAEMKSAYEKADGNTSLAIDRAEATSVSTPAVAGITRAEYVDALNKAHRTLSGNALAKEVANIQAARVKGRANNM